VRVVVGVLRDGLFEAWEPPAWARVVFIDD
jgi:hypothetical protein